MKEKQSKKELAGILFFLLGAGMLVSSAFLCVGSDIWYDEVFSLGLVRKPVWELIFLAALSLYAAAGSISCKKVFWYAERWTVLFPDHVHAGAFRIHG